MDRNWNVDSVPASYEFRVLLPWYKEPIFILIVFFGSILICLSLFYAISRYLWLEKLVTNRTVELSAANQNLQEEVDERTRIEEALRESKERLSLALQSSGMGTWDFDIHTGTHSWDDHVSQLFSLEASALGNEDFLAMILPDDRKQILSKITAAITENKDIDTAYRILWSNGSIHHVSIRGKLCRNQDRQADRITGVIWDITEYKKLEEQLRQSQKMEAVGKLAGGIAHDFNNLLTIILGYSDIAIRKFSASDPMQNIINEIKKAGERASALTKQLLAYSRKQVLQPQVFDLNDLIANLNAMLRRLIGEDIEFVTAASSTLGMIKADPSQVEQIIMNLVINSRDAMPGGGKLTIKTRMENFLEPRLFPQFDIEPGPYVVLSISDNGCGMDSDTVKQIFDPFFTTKDIGKGTGLGLSMVYGIVKQSGGYIYVYSELGHGTTFNIYFPRIEEGEAKSAVEKPDTQLHTGYETILLVEDEESVREMITHILRDSGYTVFETSCGTEAYSLFETNKEKISLLITDVILPKINGREIAGYLTSIKPALKVLYISGYTDDAVVHHGVLEEQIAFLQKPFSPHFILMKVREMLDA